MQPLFTIHAGEYLVGFHIEQHLRDPHGDKVNVWVPSKDTGIDLLVTDKTNKKTASLQVKFSKDFLAIDANKRRYDDHLVACGWWKFSRQKLLNSPADYWVFVLPPFKNAPVQYVVIGREDLHRKVTTIHHGDPLVHLYLWVSADGHCWEVRGLGQEAQTRLVCEGRGEELEAERDFSGCLNNWGVIFGGW
ncbi:MAG: hypothetical protein HLX50_17860 [Alteromonadaceae bacterium]|nr:hypothetical protein [Alteromonadaceae bacterium]